MLAVRLGSGPIFVILKVRFWTNLVLRCFQAKHEEYSVVFCNVRPPKVNKMKCLVLDQNDISFGPKIGPEPNFHLGADLTFKHGPFYQHFLFKTCL